MIALRFFFFGPNIVLCWPQKGVDIVEKHDKKSLYPMLIKCHNHLHLLLESKGDCVDPMVEKIAS
jgi:hypothetical protein